MQRAWLRKNYLKLKEKKKAKWQLTNEQQCQLTMPLEPILDLGTSAVMDLLANEPVKASTEENKTCEAVDTEPNVLKAQANRQYLFTRVKYTFL